MICVRIRNGRGEHTDTGGHITTEVEIGVMLPYTKEFLESLEARRGKDRFSHRASKGNTVLLIPS